jgi:serine/threonine-protein kinase
MVRKVGTSRIVREIGRGGMGVVYEGFQDELERRVAVKALDPRAARSKEIVERFRREGKVYARLRHEAIVGVHDLVEKDDDALYLVTDFVDGADLSKLLAAGGPLPPECVALVGAKVAGALDYVHFEGLLHRDVKPANVMISREGEVKLMDFGIAKGVGTDDLTATGLVVGSPSYLAPEVLEGEDATPRADVWALGVTLYELATGEKPFTGRSADDLFRQIRKGRLRPVRALAPDCPRRLARAIERCLARDPAARWDRAGALARVLDGLAARALRKMHPRARLVALMAHRGFAPEEAALEFVTAEELSETRAMDTERAKAPPAPGRFRPLVAAAIAAIVGAAVLLFPS